MAAATLAAAVSLAGCTTPDTPIHAPTAGPSTPAVPHGGPMLPATATAPAYLSSANVPSETADGTLPLVHSVAANAVSIPWGLISRDGSTGALTVVADDGGCVSAPFGYTATVRSKTVVVLAIYSTNTLPSYAQGCAGVGHLVTYRLTLPPADVKLSLAHAPY